MSTAAAVVSTLCLMIKEDYMEIETSMKFFQAAN